MSKWIDVNDRLPEDDTRVLVAINYENIKVFKRHYPKLDTDRRFGGN